MRVLKLKISVNLYGSESSTAHASTLTYSQVCRLKQEKKISHVQTARSFTWN